MKFKKYCSILYVLRWRLCLGSGGFVNIVNRAIRGEVIYRICCVDYFTTFTMCACLCFDFALPQKHNNVDYVVWELFISCNRLITTIVNIFFQRCFPSNLKELIVAKLHSLTLDSRTINTDSECVNIYSMDENIINYSRSADAICLSISYMNMGITLPTRLGTVLSGGDEVTLYAVR